MPISYAQENRFQQYIQTYTKPPIPDYSMTTTFFPRRYRYPVFSYDSYYFYSQLQEREKFIKSQGINTYTPSDEYKIFN